MRLFAVLVTVVCIVASPGHTANDTTSSALDLAELARGRLGGLCAVLPGCPACEDAIGWRGAVYHAYPRVRLLLVSPSTNAELEAASVRLDWPFTEAELVRGLDELATAPREGPWQFLGAVVPLGMGRTLDGEIADLDALSRPLLLVFFSPDCPPCWDALPGLVELTEKILPVVVVLAPHALSADDRERLSEAGLVVVHDDEQDLVRTFAVRATPTYVVLDAEGVIRWVHEGIVDQEVLRRAVLAVVSDGGTGE